LTTLPSVQYDTSMKTAFHSLLIIISFVIAVIWQNTSLKDITIPAIGVLVFLYLITSSRKKAVEPASPLPSQGGPAGTKKNLASLILDKDAWNIFLLNTALLLLVFSTGGFQSPLYFLLYFVSFGLAFVLTPEVVFVFAGCLLLLFLPDAMKGEIGANLIRLGSLILLSPLAFFFGREFRERFRKDKEMETVRGENTESANRISADVSDLLNRDQNKLDSKDVAELDEILQEAEKLREK